MLRSSKFWLNFEGKQIYIFEDGVVPFGMTFLLQKKTNQQLLTIQFLCRVETPSLVMGWWNVN
jgi:hypothetical protein